jgi:excisionase family DNA binding protein
VSIGGGEATVRPYLTPVCHTYTREKSLIVISARGVACEKCALAGDQNIDERVPHLASWAQRLLGGDQNLMDSIDGLISSVAAKQEAWTVPELAQLLSLSKGEIYQQVKTGKLPALRIGTNIRLCPKITSEWLRARLTA